MPRNWNFTWIYLSLWINYLMENDQPLPNYLSPFYRRWRKTYPWFAAYGNKTRNLNLYTLTSSLSENKYTNILLSTFFKMNMIMLLAIKYKSVRYYSYIRCHHWVTGTWDTTSNFCNFLWVYNYFKI